jgi:hypothetical protein
VGREHARLVRDAELCEGLAAVTHGLPVGPAPHEHRNERPGRVPHIGA